MKLVAEKTDKLSGIAKVPESKSHTIRAIIFASLADGESTINGALFSEDTKAAIDACKKLGAQISIKNNIINIIGFSGQPSATTQKINTLNSGTTTNLIASVSALCDKKIIIDGDDSIRKRPVQPLLDIIE
jgi:3-phosphoshikimate 1-carboxyvinyltransferase